MPLKKDEIVSAQVILRPASGKRITDLTVITVENVKEFIPEEGAAVSATVTFHSEGFEVGPIIGISFSITGPVKVFERFFMVPLHRGKDGAIKFIIEGKVQVSELPAEKLPGELRKSVLTVVFPLPPDFGPTEYHI